MLIFETTDRNVVEEFVAKDNFYTERLVRRYEIKELLIRFRTK